jgi:hypothetical protein
MREEDLWDMSDEELTKAFKEAQASEDSPETDLEEDQVPEEFAESDSSTEEVGEDVEEDEEVENENGPEQLEDDDNLEDSGHDASDESETDEVADEDEEETTEDDPDGESEEEEPSSDDTEDDEEEEQPVQSYKFRANGKEYEFSSEEIVDQFPKIFGQAMDYTKKMQTIKPWRKTIDAIESAKLTHDDVSLMIDVLKGDKGAITEVLKRTGVDTLELDSDENKPYVAKDYGRDDGALAIKDIVDDISQDVEYATTHNILSKEWDDRSWATIAENPEMIKLLHTDVKSGMYSKLQPLAEKLKVFDGGRKSDLDYYKEAAQQHFNQVAEQEAYEERLAERQAAKEAKEAEKARLAEIKARSEKRSATKQASAKRKAAAPTKVATPARDVIDYLDDSDEAFDEWYQRLQNEM